MKLGARIFKTGISVTVALYIASRLSMDPIVFAAIAAVLTVQPSVYRSWKYVKDVILSNLIGASFALLMLTTLGDSPLVVGLTVIMIIGANLGLKLHQSVNLSVLTAIAIMESVVGGPAWSFALDRFSTIMVGVGSSLVVNVFFLPPKYETRLYETLYQWHTSLSFLLRHIHADHLAHKALRAEQEKLHKQLKKAEELFDLHRDERRHFLSLSSKKTLRHLVVFRQMTRTLRLQNRLFDALKKHTPAIKTHAKEQEDIAHTSEALIRYQEYLFLSYEEKTSGINHNAHQNATTWERKTIPELMRFDSPSDIHIWPHIFPVASLLIEINKELEQLEKLIRRCPTPYMKKRTP